tara:strand:+ start:3378 stop:3830 length:453 start_codon:yes stop_codon:yes gene_type:complete
MSTKLDITNSINTIDDGGLNTALEVRTTLNTLKDNAYGSVINDTQATTNILTADNATNRQYNINIVKQGRKVLLIGFLKNNTASMISGEVFLTINAGEYTQDSNVITFYAKKQFGGSNVRCSLGANTLTLIDTIGANETIFFETTYFTQN